MTVMIFKDNVLQKSFKKYLPYLALSVQLEWVNSHFPKAKKKEIDGKYNTIYIFY